MNRWKEYFQELLNFNSNILHLDEHSPYQNLIQPKTEQEIITCFKLRDIIEMGDTQFGFMPGRSTTDAIHAFRQMSIKYKEKNKKLHMVFFDLEKAFDRIPKKLIWWALRHKNLPEKYKRIIQDMYMVHTTMVRSTTGTSAGFTRVFIKDRLLAQFSS
ncbi:uncharacterized protein LOC135926918 [Gordionus sp. m RMFG-2023]|uniref:uncharacterized protein LOC135926918 n=1 Tax=Gordionus sp. m RMFG-2023 TaxID=3053472 RepID=UPI0031FC43D4